MLGFQPLRVACACFEVGVVHDCTEEGEVGRDAFDRCILQRSLGFDHHVLPGARGDDQFGNDAVEISADDCRDVGDEVRVDADAVAGGEAEGLDFADAEGVRFLGVFGGDAELD